MNTVYCHQWNCTCTELCQEHIFCQDVRHCVRCKRSWDAEYSNVRQVLWIQLFILCFNAFDCTLMIPFPSAKRKQTETCSAFEMLDVLSTLIVSSYHWFNSEAMPLSLYTWNHNLFLHNKQCIFDEQSQIWIMYSWALTTFI